MSEKRYIISDASKQVDVEAHVLRYWEEELMLDIPRNEMGHRYYTEEIIKLLKNIKVLKDQGFQLKAIKMVLPELLTTGENNLDYMLGLKEELNNKVQEEEAKAEKSIKPDKSEISEDNAVKLLHMTVQPETRDKQAENAVLETDRRVSTPLPVSEDKLQQFQMIMNNIISQALAENNPQLGQEISEKVSDNVLKEMDYLMRMQDEKEEQRFKKLDETIRIYQKGRQEVAAVQERQKKEKKKRKLFKKRA